MANNFVTPKLIAKEALAHLENAMVLGDKVHKDYSSDFKSAGETISVRRPVRFLGQENNLDITSYNEDIEEGFSEVKMDKTVTVPFSIDADDATLSIDSTRIQERYIEPAVTKMKDVIEAKLAGLYSDVYNFVGTPGTVISTMRQLATAGVNLTNSAAPNSMRCGFHSPETILELADGLKTVFPQTSSKKAIEEASVGRYGGFENYESVHMPLHTVGAYAGTPLVKGASQSTAYSDADDIDSSKFVRDTHRQVLATDGWSTSVTGLLNKGDVFTIAGVFSVNPISKQTTGNLQTFVVKSDTDSDGSGNADITISPPIITSGPYQTVTAAPADNAEIVVVSGAAGSSHKQSLFMHKNAFSLVTRPLKIPTAGLKSHTVMGNNMSISVTEDGDFKTLKHQYRLDILFGVDLNHELLVCRGTN